ncbi:transcription factor IIIB 50 kDa subunit-like isoform X2 [Xenopus laevis]|nr:transcription factor IIIB 50 kDa subunit-like isoform X2 [Xenopus laevis]
MKRGIVRVQDLCRVLRLPNGFVDTAVSYYKQAVVNPLYRLMSIQKKEIIVACCVYITCRQHQWPITMATLCTLIYAKKELFASLFLDIVQVLKVDVPSLSLQNLIKSHCSSFKLFKDSYEVPPQYAEKLDAVSERTVQIVELAYETWLVTGRHPIPMITAAAYISWQSLQPSRRMSCTLSRFCKMSDIDMPPPSTIRLKELQETLIKLANYLPWLKILSLNRKNIVQHLGDLLKHRAYLLRRALAITEAELSKGTEAPSSTDLPNSTVVFLPPCVTNPRKRARSTPFPRGHMDITGDEDISDSEIEQYLRTPAEMKDFQLLQTSISSV